MCSKKKRKNHIISIKDYSIYAYRALRPSLLVPLDECQ